MKFSFRVDWIHGVRCYSVHAVDGCVIGHLRPSYHALAGRGWAAYRDRWVPAVGGGGPRKVGWFKTREQAAAALENF
jgi:hypothetical protein